MQVGFPDLSAGYLRRDWSLLPVGRFHRQRELLLCATEPQKTPKPAGNLNKGPSRKTLHEELPFKLHARFGLSTWRQGLVSELTRRRRTFFKYLTSGTEAVGAVMPSGNLSGACMIKISSGGWRGRVRRTQGVWARRTMVV